ncbi:MAG: universal stress protein [Acidobacteria bacterium]|nr:universal stress protein [Acidobacteriota bacterium]
MHEKILVAFDGGRGSLGALQWAAAHVGEGDRLRVVSVEELNVFAVPVQTSSGRNAAESLEDAEEWMRLNAPGVAADFIRDTGDVAEVLLRQSAHADICVVGTQRGGSDLGRLEPVPRKLATLVEHPVIVVPSSNASPAGPVVVGVSEDEVSTAPVMFAAAAASRAGRPLRIVHAWWVVPHSDWDGKESESGAAVAHRAVVETALELVAEQYPALILTGDSIVGETLSVLRDAAESASLTVVGRRRTTRLSAWMLGSVAHDLLSVLPCPIAVVPTRESAQSVA